MMKRIIILLAFLAAAAAPQNARANNDLWLESTETQPNAELNIPSFAPLIDKLGKAVVNISIEGKEGPPAMGKKEQFGAQRPDRDSQQQSPFDFFFQLPPEMMGRRSFQSLGSGFVIHPDGYIVTNNHVVDKATSIKVSFRDEKKTYDAKVIGIDTKTDLALLKVNTGHPLTAVALGDSDKIRPGDWVIAIGNPFRLGHTATLGIVSAKSRKMPGGGPYDDFIQTDASINPGNSGGPLFNSRGEVIGVNTAIMSPGRMGATGFNIGIGFATPINLVKEIISQLHKKGKVVRGWLGVMIQPVDQDTAEALKLESAEGALVADVQNDSPAKAAGIEHGDVIVSFDGKKVSENDELPILVARTEIGKEVEVGIIRHGKASTVKVKIAELKSTDEEPESEEAEENRLGLSVQDLTPDIARSLGLEESTGVVVSNVAPDSEADRKGLRRGDVIVELDSQPVNSAAAFRKHTKDLPKNKPILLLVNRNNNTIFFTLKLE